MKTIKQIIKDNKLKEKEKIKYPIKEYDKKGNEIYYKDFYGFEYWKEYDKNDNVINELIHYSNGKWELNDKELIEEK